MKIIWSEENQQYITVPDGDIATHKQIHEYYETNPIVKDSTKFYANGKLLYEKMEEHIPHLY